MGADGISYLDIGDAYWRGDWPTAINAMWSPFYSWLTGLTLLVFQPSPYWEFTVIQLLNFAIYLLSLAAFAFFLRELRRFVKRKSKPVTRQAIYRAAGMGVAGFRLRALRVDIALDESRGAHES
jgi:hypothetical protein